jgi:hypothetical protein
VKPMHLKHAPSNARCALSDLSDRSQPVDRPDHKWRR